MDGKQKRKNFLKYANIRLDNALKCIARIKPLANKRYYEYSPAEKKIILSKLNDSLSEVKKAFAEKETVKKDKDKRKNYFL
jgi:hypothetical protein